MALEKIISVDSIEVKSNGCVQVRTVTSISEDGDVISQSLHRHVVAPGDDYSEEDSRVQAVCALIHTPEVIEKYKASATVKGV